MGRTEILPNPFQRSLDNRNFRTNFHHDVLRKAIKQKSPEFLRSFLYSDASAEFIQEVLGHMDKKTTENYLDSFEQQVKKEFAKKLEAFKKISEELEVD